MFWTGKSEENPGGGAAPGGCDMGAAPSVPSASTRSSPRNEDFDVLELHIETSTQAETPMGITMGHVLSRQSLRTVPAVAAIAITPGGPFHSAGVQFGDHILSVSSVTSLNPVQVAKLIRDADTIKGPLNVRIARPRGSQMQPLRIMLPSIMISGICLKTSYVGVTVMCPLPSVDVLQSCPLASGDEVLQVGTERPRDAEHASSLLKGWTADCTSVQLVIARASLQTLEGNSCMRIFVFKSSAGQALGVELSSREPWTYVHALHGPWPNVLVDAGLALQDGIWCVNGEPVTGFKHAAALLRQAVGRVEILIQRKRGDAEGSQHAVMQASKEGELQGGAHEVQSCRI